MRLREALGRLAADHPDALIGPLQQDAVHSGDLSGLKRLATMGPDMLTAVLEDPGHRETLLTIAKILQDSPAGLKALGVKLQTVATTQGACFRLSVEETVALLTATRNAEIHKAVLSSVGEQLHRYAAHWGSQDPLGTLTPVLAVMEDRGRETRATAGPPYDHHARQFMLAANEAYLLRIALHAHFDDLSAPPWTNSCATWRAWPSRNSCSSSRQVAGRSPCTHGADASNTCPTCAAVSPPRTTGRPPEPLLDRVLDFTNRVHPSGKGNWRDGLANDWRRYLRVVGLEDRERLTGTILDFAGRDIAFAKQLVEVAGQSLGDISPELYALMRDPRTPPALMPTLRSTASWAGRAAHGEAWTEVFAEVASARSRPLSREADRTPLTRRGKGTAGRPLSLESSYVTARPGREHYHREGAGAGCARSRQTPGRIGPVDYDRVHNLGFWTRTPDRGLAPPPLSRRLSRPRRNRRAQVEEDRRRPECRNIDRHRAVPLHADVTRVQAEVGGARGAGYRERGAQAAGDGGTGHRLEAHQELAAVGDGESDEPDPGSSTVRNRVCAGVPAPTPDSARARTGTSGWPVTAATRAASSSAPAEVSSVAGPKPKPTL